MKEFCIGKSIAKAILFLTNEETKNNTKSTGNIYKTLYNSTIKPRICKYLKIMKLTATFILIACLQVSAKSNAQTNVTLSLKEASLEDVFKAIEKQTGFVFMFETKAIQKSKKVTISAKEKPLTEILNKCLENQNLTYNIIDKNVIVRLIEPKLENTNKVINVIRTEIKGRLINRKGEPIPGASIRCIKTNKNTVSDSNGEFIIKDAYEVESVIISSVGYETINIDLNRSDSHIITLEYKVNSLDETVVIAYGTTTRRFNTGNITSIKSTDIGNQPINNPLLALQGRVPGLFVTQTSGIPGAALSVRIQGQNSIRSGNNPFYVIDGVPYISELPSTGLDRIIGTGNPLNYINSSDIESIEILKDADATAIYGSRAANGAILITTKKGLPGQTKINVTLKTGIGNNPRHLNMMQTSQYLDMRKKAYKNDGISNIPNSAYDLKVWDSTRNTDWQDALIDNTAHYTNLSSSISGGTTNLQYLISATYQKETTVFSHTNSNQKGSLHININSVSANNKLKINFTSNSMIDKSELPRTDLTQLAITLEPNAPQLFSEDGTLNWAQNSDGVSTWVNPLAAALYSVYENKTFNLVNSINLGYKIIRNLELGTNIGYTYLQTDDYYPIPSTIYRPERRATSIVASSFGARNISSWTVEPQINYKQFLHNGRIEYLLGATILQNDTKTQSFQGTGYSSDNSLRNIGAASQISGSNTVSQYKYNALFGRINFVKNDKYIINVNVRRDGSSRFGKENHFQNFASVGAAWIFSDEKLFRNQSLITFGKLHGSYGTTGNDQIENYSYLSLYNYTPNYGRPYQGGAGLLPDRLPNPYLQWEKTKKLQGGIELGLLKDRVFITAIIARNRSSNQLLSYSVSSVTGFDNINRNFPATVQNTSKEFTLRTTNISSRSLQWVTNINFTIPKNKLISFPDLSTSAYASTLMVGKPLGIERLLLYKGVDPSTGLYKFSDVHGQETTAPNTDIDKTTIFSSFPKYYGGIQNTLTYKGMVFDFLIQYSNQKTLSGINQFNGLNIVPGVFSTGMSNQPVTAINDWEKPGDQASIMPYSATNSGKYRTSLSYLRQSTAVAEDASFIRLKNVNITYNIPNKIEKKMGISDCSVFVQGQNILTITNYSGLDPETQSIQSLPPLRILSAGINVIF